MAEHPTTSVVLTGAPLRPGQVEDVARSGAKVELSPDLVEGLERSRQTVVDALSTGDPHYGINTGFGSLARKRIPPDDLAALQKNLVRSHSAGAGDPLDDDIVRATMLTLAASLARGRSGVRRVVVDSLIALLNAGITPVVPELGSVGASGDLAPLAHIALSLIGEGRAEWNGQVLESAEALASAGIQPLELQAKEGLALLNGTHLMAGRAALLLCDLERVIDGACLAAAMSLDGIRGSAGPYDARILSIRNHPGPRRVALRMSRLLRGSEILTSHVENDPRVQDPYSFRCNPQVMGAAIDAIHYVRDAVRRELGAVTDNPVVEPDGAILAGGNFHGMPIAIPLDIAAVAMSHVAGIAERRIFFMLSGQDPESHLNPHLSGEPGLHSGMMVAQYTAAACCNELAGLAVPASVTNIPTCANVEDYNSFGPRSAAKAARALALLQTVVSIELLCAAQALETHRPLRSSPAIEEAHAKIRLVVPAWSGDRPLSDDIASIEALISNGAFAPGGECEPWFPEEAKL
ncbi:MAG: histidine ammonia-lyase [Myxococcales bacterium]|nr:histidine ammonia-lyase [Myxococcales bacterium]